MVIYITLVLIALVAAAVLVLAGYQLAMHRFRTSPHDLRALHKALKDEKALLETQQERVNVELASVLKLANAHKGFYEAIKRAAQQTPEVGQGLQEYESRTASEGVRIDAGNELMTV